MSACPLFTASPGEAIIFLTVPAVWAVIFVSIFMASSNVPTAAITHNTAATELTCSLNAISVTATGGASYSWSDGTTEVSTTADLTITAVGTYTVTATAANGCTATASIIITKDSNVPTAAITNNTAATELTCSLNAISVKPALYVVRSPL